MKNNTYGISKYKQILKKLKITHKEVALYTGQSRENITVLLNGKSLPKFRAIHISNEIEELIKINKFDLNNRKNQNLNVFGDLQLKIDEISREINNIKKEFIIKHIF